MSSPVLTAEPSTWAPASRRSCKRHRKDRRLGKEPFRRTNQPGLGVRKENQRVQSEEGAHTKSTTSFFNLLYGHGCAIGICQLQRALQSEHEIHLSSMLCTGSRAPPGNCRAGHTPWSLGREVWQLQGFVPQNLLLLSGWEGKSPLPGEGERVKG